jgi:hypothetical protein
MKSKRWQRDAQRLGDGLLAKTSRTPSPDFLEVFVCRHMRRPALRSLSGQRVTEQVPEFSAHLKKIPE